LLCEPEPADQFYERIQASIAEYEASTQGKEGSHVVEELLEEVYDEVGACCMHGGGEAVHARC
jgi:hypothetical protein